MKNQKPLPVLFYFRKTFHPPLIFRSFLAGLLVLASLCTAATAIAEPLPIFVSVPPHAFIAEKIGGDKVSVTTMINGGQDPHTFEPSPRQVVALGRAAIYFTAGLDFERRLLRKIAGVNKHLSIIETTADIELKEIKAEDTDTDHGHEHGHDHGHDEHELDPHVWLSPTLLLVQAENIANGLARIDPDHGHEYHQRLNEFKKEATKLKNRLQQQLAPYRGRAFFVFHPAFGYFGRDFGLQQVAVETGGSSPSPRQLSKLIAKARSQKVKVIFTQPQFDQRSAHVVASAIGGAVMPMDPMGKDVFNNFAQIADNLQIALQGE